MKYESQIETYRFVGNSITNKAKKIVNGKTVAMYTQTGIIDTFNENKHLVCGGSKLFSKKNDSRVGYMVYFGKDKTNPDQIIKIVLEKESLDKGDVNALAIDSLCQHAIRINKINNKKIALVTTASVLGGLVIAGSLIGGMIWADQKEGEVQNKKVESHQDWLTEQRMENGTYKSWLEEQGLIDEESVNEVLNSEQTNGRSY